MLDVRLMAVSKIEVLQELLEDIEKLGDRCDVGFIKAIIQGKKEGNENFIKWLDGEDNA